jgi:hypothetical protein
MSGISYLPAAAASSAIPAGLPKTSTPMIAFVFSLIRLSTARGRTLSVRGSQSTNTGVAPTCSTQLAEATKLKAGVITSSPGPTPRAARQR